MHSIFKYNKSGVYRNQFIARELIPSIWVTLRVTTNNYIIFTSSVTVTGVGVNNKWNHFIHGVPYSFPTQVNSKGLVIFLNIFLD